MIDYEAQLKDGVPDGYLRLAYDPWNYELTPTLPSRATGKLPRQFIGTRATVGSIDGVDPFHERRASRAFAADWKRQRPERAACA